jgi:3'-phosphoadenosine 5'-phosphosulfate sulfotransferase
MKRRDLLRRIRQEAKAHRKEVTESEGGSQSKITVGKTSVRVLRLVEINIETARAIMRDLDEEFGKGWSRL